MTDSLKLAPAATVWSTVAEAPAADWVTVEWLPSPPAPPPAWVTLAIAPAVWLTTEY